MILEEIKKEMEEVAGNWNGEDSGYKEEQAGYANEIIEHINAIETLIKEMNS